MQYYKKILYFIKIVLLWNLGLFFLSLSFYFYFKNLKLKDKLIFYFYFVSLFNIFKKNQQKLFFQLDLIEFLQRFLVK